MLGDGEHGAGEIASPLRHHSPRHLAARSVAGAELAEEPTDQEYGERRFTAKDPEGHLWFFGQVIRETAPEEWRATAAKGS